MLPQEEEFKSLCRRRYPKSKNRISIRRRGENLRQCIVCGSTRGCCHDADWHMQVAYAQTHRLPLSEHYRYLSAVLVAGVYLSPEQWQNR